VAYEPTRRPLPLRFYEFANLLHVALDEPRRVRQPSQVCRYRKRLVQDGHDDPWCAALPASAFEEVRHRSSRQLGEGHI